MSKHKLILCLALLAAGCQSARVDKSLTADLGANDEETQLEFWHSLANQPITSNDDAFHGMLLFLDNADPSPDYATRVAALKDRGLLSKGFDEDANRAVDRGTLAMVLSKALKIRGGVVMAVTGANPRYSTKELVFLGIFPPSSPNQTFSGTEYLGIIGKAEDFQRVARAGTSRPLASLQVENDIQAGQKSPTPEGSAPANTTPLTPPAE